LADFPALELLLIFEEAFAFELMSAPRRPTKMSARRHSDGSGLVGADL
jgi:hypothetical protein